jgi:nitrate reductase gamma subunit
VGAAAAVLPAKSLLCMACHAATPTLGDTASLLGFGVFAIGMFLALAPLCLVGVRGRKGSGGPGFVPALSAVFFDGLLQRRLYRTSPWRWFVHALIFQPFVIRFLWGLAAMVGSYAAPDAGWTLALINKNNPLTALVFDLTGLALVTGCILALVRGAKADKDLLPGLPRQDKAALWLLLAAVLLGFVTEGARMALTGMPDGSGFGFVGALFVALFPQGAASTVYGWLWYAHAIAWCAFVAYLPFSRLRHIIMAPIVLAMNAGKKHGH